MNPDTTNWYISPAQFADENTTSFDRLYVASDETSLNTILGIEVVGQYIWLFTRTQIEFWYDSGAADFPFQRVQGVTVEAGAISPYAIAKIPTTQATPNGGIMWLGRDRTGETRASISANRRRPLPSRHFRLMGRCKPWAICPGQSRTDMFSTS
ncbi:hypothetical protein JK222_14530 [Gluconobacter cerinus]|uniref:hypothetical protein n=1 Tax=Gluconobacter cerinus TaxID=38307 RepID=UPI001B8CFB35|nr:hypothetical protein [Gluconobacter cerinus]MBS1072902.1 hypothetical protein [Gluconobacter cerinus]